MQKQRRCFHAKNKNLSYLKKNPYIFKIDTQLLIFRLAATYTWDQPLKMTKILLSLKKPSEILIYKKSNQYLNIYNLPPVYSRYKQATSV